MFEHLLLRTKVGGWHMMEGVFRFSFIFTSIGIYISYLGFGLEPVDDQDALKVDNCRVAIFFIVV